MPPLFPTPELGLPPASNAMLLFKADRFEETVAFCEKELAHLEKEIPARSVGLPQLEQASSAPYQYFGLTAILVNALAELARWKNAKEVLGRYRTHYPRDPWGYFAGAEVTRRDPRIRDREAVQRAAEMLEADGKRLELKAASKHEKAK